MTSRTRSYHTNQRSQTLAIFGKPCKKVDRAAIAKIRSLASKNVAYSAQILRKNQKSCLGTFKPYPWHTLGTQTLAIFGKPCKKVDRAAIAKIRSLASKNVAYSAQILRKNQKSSPNLTLGTLFDTREAWCLQNTASVMCQTRHHHRIR